MTSEVATSKGASSTSIAQLLDHLFKTVHPPGRGEYTLQEVVALAADAGYKFSATTVWELRKGRKDNPTAQVLNGLAAVFGVPPGYFLDPEVSERVNAELDLVVAMRDAGVQGIALRSHGLSPEGLRTVQEMIDHVRKLERLPEVDGDTSGS